MDQNMLEQVIFHLTSPDNGIRGEAEKAFNQAAEQPDALLPQLLHLMRASSNISVRNMSAILFRRYSFQDQRVLWNRCSPQVQAGLKTGLLQALTQEQDRTMRQKLCHVISSTGKYLGGNWPELLSFMFECCNAPSTELREAALEIFANLPGMFGANLSRYIMVLKEIFQKSLLDPDFKVKLAALKATTSFLLFVEEPQQRNVFGELLSPMLEVIAMALNNNDEEAARDAIGSFIELAESTPTLLRRSLDGLVPAMSQITSTPSVEDITRHLALELLVTLTENAPGMIRKFTKFVETVYPAAWTLMVDIDDDQDWHQADIIENDEMDSNPIVGEQAIDRIACALGGKTVIPYAFNILPGMLQNPDWRYRYAALMTLSAIGEGCHKVMEKELDKIIGVIWKLHQDPHPRVRYALCNALGQMSTDFAPQLQNKFHQVVLPVFLFAMDDQGNPRVQAHGAAALVNFCEEATKQILTPYLDSILSKLLNLIKSSQKTYVLEQAVTTLATVADSAQDRFMQYYDTFIPILIEVLLKANGKELRLLKGKTVECISLIGLAVGKAKFVTEAKNLMQILLETKANEMDPDDPQVPYMLSSFARIGAILGEDFIPYLPVVMPPLLRSATLKPDVTILSSDDDVGDYDPSDGWEILQLEDQRIGIKTSVLEEKCTAIEMLYCYAKELKEGFHQYASKVLEIVVPLLKFYFDDSVRCAAAVAIAPLLKSLQLAHYAPHVIGDLWLNSLTPFLEVIQAEAAPETAAKLIEGFFSCVDTMGEGCMQPSHLIKFGEAMRHQIGEALTRERERIERRNQEDHDEEAEDVLNDESASDEYVLDEIANAIHTVFKTHKGDFLPHFEHTVPLVIEMLHQNRTETQRHWALAIVDDVIEFTGPHSWKYHEVFVPALAQALLDSNPDIRQVAAYGIGICAKNGGPYYAQSCADFVPRLIQMISDPYSREDDNVNATENAISALAKIAEFNGSKVEINQLLVTWLSFLPILADVEETAYCCDFLCRLIEGNHPVVLGENHSNLPRIFQIFAEVLVSESLEEKTELIHRIYNLLQSIERQVNESARSALWSQVQDEFKQRLAELFK